MRRCLLLLPAAALAQPLADHHQHLFSPAARRLWCFSMNSCRRLLTSRFKSPTWAAPERAARIVERIRQFGVQRMLFGSDAPVANNVPRLTWAALRTLPLSDAECRTIDTNLGPYMR